MKLFHQKLGEGPAILILHGLYGSSDNWVTFARTLSAKYSVYLIDLRNHGRSPHNKEHSYETMCSDIKEFAENEKIDRFVLIGHSMGGKVAMLFALKYPEYLNGLIVVDIAPVSYSSTDTYNTIVISHLNIIHALLSLDFSKISSRSEIERELEADIKDVSVRQFMLKNVQRNQDGSFRWKFNLEALNNAMPQIMKFLPPDKDQVSQLVRELPVLFVKGERSEYILAEHLPVIKEFFPNATIIVIQDAGHWVHAEQPARFLEAIDGYLSKLPGADG